MATTVPTMRGRCGADRAGSARPAGARTMDARTGTCVGALRPGMVTQVKGGLDANGKIATGTMSCGATRTRRARNGRCAALGAHIAEAIPAAAPKPIQPKGGGDRNADPALQSRRKARI